MCQDSVAEHQATPPRAYWRYFHVVTYLGPAGLFRTMYKDSRPRTQAEYFLGECRPGQTRGARRGGGAHQRGALH
jgi:hypothetical protein